MTGMLATTRRWSLQAVKADLCAIWSMAIQKHLKVHPSDFKVRTLYMSQPLSAISSVH